MENSEKLSEILTNVKEGEETIITLAHNLDEEGKRELINLTFGNRTLNPEPPQVPPRMESPSRVHTFHNIEGFRKYLEKRGGDDTLVLADVSEGEMVAVLDETAKQGIEIITFKPPLHPLYMPWDSINASNKDGGIPIRLLVDFLMVNRRAIVKPEDKELILTLSQVRASKTTELIRGRGLKCVNSIKVEVEIQGQSGREQVDLPETITIMVPLFIDTPAVEIEFDLLLFEQQGEIYARLATSDDEVKMIEAFQGMIYAIEKLEKGTVGMGSIKFCDWKYLTENHPNGSMRTGPL